MEDDPFGSLIDRCQPTSSQEERFPNCPFARQSEVASDDDESSPLSSSQPTGIIMLSLPETQKDENTPREEEDNFQTPPDHSQSQPTSYEEQRPANTASDAHAGNPIDGGGHVGDTTPLNDVCTDAEQAVDLGKDSENLGFSQPNFAQEIGSGNVVSGANCCGRVNGIHDSEVSECGLKEFRVLEGQSDESLSKKLRVSKGNLGLESENVTAGCTEPIMIADEHNEIASAVIIELEPEAICEGPRLGEDTLIMDSPVKLPEEDVSASESYKVCKNGDPGSNRKNIEDIEKFKYVASDGIDQHGKEKTVGGRREFPYSISGQEMHVGGEVELESVSTKNQLLKDILDALKMVAGELDDGSENVDFLETAKRIGMTFPRPRWWLPEGF